MRQRERVLFSHFVQTKTAMTILLSLFTWAIPGLETSLIWPCCRDIKVSIYLASLNQRQISYGKSCNDSQGSCSKQVCMNNECLVRQIRRGQASVWTKQMCWCAMCGIIVCRGRTLEIQTSSPIYAPHQKYRYTWRNCRVKAESLAKLKKARSP